MDNGSILHCVSNHAFCWANYFNVNRHVASNQFVMDQSQSM